jgi:hypothetical protein
LHERGEGKIERPSVEGFNPCAFSAEIVLSLSSRSVPDVMGEDLSSMDGDGGDECLSASV